MRDNAQWNDIVGMLKVQGPDLDLVLLEQWAGTLDVADTWRPSASSRSRLPASSPFVVQLSAPTEKGDSRITRSDRLATAGPHQLG